MPKLIIKKIEKKESNRNQMMKQQVINYEFDILQHHLIHSSQAVPHRPPNTHRYSQWKLLTTLSLIPDWEEKELKWIGNVEGSCVIAFFYATFRVCAGKQDILIRLKYSLYKICQYCLNFSEQKSLVQFIGLLEQDEPLISTYLQKNPNLEDLLLKIYDASISLVKLDNEAGANPFIKLQYYSQLLFGFLMVEVIGKGESGIQISLAGLEERVYVVRQKDCFFVIENKGKEIRQNKKKSLEHRNNFEECSIIDEAADEQETIMKESSKRVTPPSGTKNKSPKSPESRVRGNLGENKTSSGKSPRRKIPKFLCNSNHPRKPRQPRASLHQMTQPAHQQPKPQKKLIQQPIKQNYSKKLLVNYDKNLPSYVVPSNSANKSISNKTMSKKSRDYSGGAYSPPQIGISKTYKNINEAPKKTFPYPPKPQTMGNIPPSVRYRQYDSEQMIKGRTQAHSPQRSKKTTVQNSINPNSLISSLARHSQDHSQRFISETFHQNPQVPAQMTRNHKNTRSNHHRMSQSPLLMPVQNK